ncbi:hypothetical protein ACWWU7_03470 [Stenotrophomonas sp. SM006]
MSNDNKTLADAQPDGRVRLGDELLPCPFCGAPAERIDFGIGSAENEGGSCIACTVCQHSGPIEFGFKENFVSNWNRRALSAQPSPGGQGDALLDQARKLFDELGAIADDDRCVAILAAALAARQPVGEPVAVRVTPEMRAAFRKAYREGGFWHDRLDTALDAMMRAARPAQAVDLGELRRLSDGWLARSDRLSVTQQRKAGAYWACAKELRDWLDSQAVGNG